jgi:hypothetical protein
MISLALAPNPPKNASWLEMIFYLKRSLLQEENAARLFTPQGMIS